MVYGGEGNGTPLQYSCLENPMDGGTWWAAVHGVTKSQTLTERLHFHFSLSLIGEGNGNPLQCSCLENPRDGGAWWAAVSGAAQSRTRLKQLSSSSSSSSSGVRTRKVCACLVAQSCLTLCDPMDCSPPGFSVQVDSPGKNTGVDCHALLQGIFPSQGSNPGLPHSRRILYHLSHQGSPWTRKGTKSNYLSFGL